MIPNFAPTPYASRSLTHTPYSQLDTKPMYPQTWTIPYTEETSPVDSYNQDPSAIYLPNQQTITNMYAQGYQCHQENQRVLQNRQILEQDNPASFPIHGLPPVTTPLIHTAAAAVPTEPLSPLNMTSIQSALPLTLPERPHPRQLQDRETSLPQRQLPIPQPSTSQNIRNVVDQIQDQRLRAASSTGGTNLNKTNTYGQLPNWTTTNDAKSQVATTQEPMDKEVRAQAHFPVLLDNINVHEELATSAPLKAETEDPDSVAAMSQPQLTFSTAPLLEPCSVAMPAVYSNFRNCPVPAAPSTDTGSNFTRQSSQISLYRYNMPAKRHSTGTTAGEGTLVSGQQYTPLDTSDTYHTSNYDNRATPIHRPSMSKIDRAF